MIFNALFSLILSIFGYSSHAQEADKVWFDTANAMAAATTPEAMRAILDQNVPGFAAELEKDSSQNRNLLNLWGLSRNIDVSHLTDGTLTVPANVLQYLNTLLNVNVAPDSVYNHAGLTHTYGYMMSNLQTPYGFKRARYVAGELESGFGMTDGLFSGLPSQGTLLSNLTTFASVIAFRDHPEMLIGLKSEVPEIANFDYSQMKVSRLVELVQNERFTLELRTDIIPFTKTNTKGPDAAMLVYSIDFHAVGQNSDPRLITVFPVDNNFASGIFAPAGLGDQLAIKLNYNAALPITVPAEQMIGLRKITDDNTTIEHSSSRRKKKF